jgi:hypothetical protein
VEDKMGLKYTVETVGELRKALAHVPDDVPFQFMFDGADYRSLDIQSLYDGKQEAFVKIEPTEE